MELLVIRHGAAMDRAEFAKTGESDDLRPLTPEGVDEMRQVARGLRAQVKKIDLLTTSPLVRAMQTAELVAEAYGVEVGETTTSLMPEAPLEEFEKWCAGHEAKKLVAVVGHEPHLGTLVTWLLSGKSESSVRLKKGGACLLEFETNARRDSGTLSWLLTPRQLSPTTGD